jgi:hypothetical protein
MSIGWIVRDDLMGVQRAVGRVRPAARCVAREDV